MLNLQRIDLNLLGPLAALLDERHVSRAAERVGLSQPAMSQALGRLRRELADELLVRGPGGYSLTPRAERLQHQLAAVLPGVIALFATDAFDPAVAAEVYNMAGTDYPVWAFGPALFRQLLRQSPQSRLRFVSWHGGVFDDLDRGLVDLVFFGATPPKNLRSEHLFTERFVCVVAAEHAYARRRGRMTLDEYLGCSHLVVDVVDGVQSVIDLRLEGLGTPRTASLTIPYHAAAPLTLPGTNLVATLPSHLVTPYASDRRLRIVPAPVEVESMDYRMVWHPRLDEDAGQRWLRELVRAVTRDLTPAT